MSRAVELLQTHESGGACLVNADRDAMLMEVMEASSRDTWMCIDPVTASEFQSLTGLPPGFQPTGYARPSYDCCLFRRPGVHAGAVEVRAFAGHRWINVARPLDVQPPVQAGGPARVTVGKDHVLGFDAGRQLRIMSLDDQDFVEVVGSGRDDAERVWPEGARLRTVELNAPLVLVLPNPTTTFFWMPDRGREFRSFQGPVSLSGSL